MASRKDRRKSEAAEIKIPIEIDVCNQSRLEIEISIACGWAENDQRLAKAGSNFRARAWAPTACFVKANGVSSEHKMASIIVGNLTRKLEDKIEM